MEMEWKPGTRRDDLIMVCTRESLQTARELASFQSLLRAEYLSCLPSVSVHNWTGV